MLLVLIVTSGYAIIRTAIPPWWIWAYWISPFAYGLRAIVVNEMTSAGWAYADQSTPPGSTVGLQALESFGFQTDQCAHRPINPRPPRLPLTSLCIAHSTPTASPDTQAFHPAPAS